MNTYTLRCGEVVPLGMECALPPLGRESATRQWKRAVGFAAAGFLLALSVFNPAIQDLLLPDAPAITASTDDAVLSRHSLICPP